MLRLHISFAVALAAVGLVSAAGAQSTWFQLRPSPSPPPRDTHSMAFDTVAAKGVVFGGYNRSVQLDDTWEWDGANWVETTPPISPSARETFPMAQDGQNGILLFGGYSFGQGLNADTWRYRSGTWTRLSPATFPAARRNHLMVSTGSSILLFGGTINAGVRSRETWEWSAGNWTNRSAGTPAPPGVGAMAYDSRRSVVVLLADTNPSRTWEWDGVTWSSRNPVTVPVLGFGNAMTYDPLRGRTVLVTGSPAATWEWDGQDWSPVTTLNHPSLRAGFSVVYDTVNDAVLLFGGRDGSTSLDGTWRYFPNPVPATFTTYGSGCPGSVGVPQLAAVAGQAPWIGETFTLEFTNLPPTVFNPAIGMIGFSRSVWNGNPLPYLLDPFGMTGCQLWIAPCVSENLANTGGTASWPIPIPSALVLVGFQFYVQGLVFDQGVNPANVVVSNAGEGAVGLR